MAKHRWATFSVEDHIDVTQLIPDILSFDRLIFPYPPDAQERKRWEDLARISHSGDGELLSLERGDGLARA